VRITKQGRQRQRLGAVREAQGSVHSITLNTTTRLGVGLDTTSCTQEGSAAPVERWKSDLDFEFRTLKLTGADGQSNPGDDEELSALDPLLAFKTNGGGWAIALRPDRVTHNPAILRKIVLLLAAEPNPMYLVSLETESQGAGEPS